MKNRNIDVEIYKKLAKDSEPKRRTFLNCVRAFFIGGLICIIAQGIQDSLVKYLDVSAVTASSTTSAILIIISVILTGIGIYDDIAQFAGAGTAIPITGFANSIASSAIEHRSEGYVLGVGGNMFKLAGSVIAFGVFSSFVVALIRFVFTLAGGN